MGSGKQKSRVYTYSFGYEVSIGKYFSLSGNKQQMNCNNLGCTKVD
jgi:hypothetical protein